MSRLEQLITPATMRDWRSREHVPSERSQGAAPAEQPARNQRLGDLLIRDGLITRPQLQDALRAQAEFTTYTPIGQILVDQRAISQEQLNAVLDKYHKKYRLGDVLVETNAITEEQLDAALQHQRRTGLRLGDALLALQLISERQMKEALCKQLSVTFIDLDHVILDPSLTRLINRRYAEQHRVIPIATIDSRITVAMDDPTDTDVVAEIESLTRSKVDVVTSTAAAFERAFTRAYGTERETGAEHPPAAPRPPAPSPDAGAAALAELRAERDALVRAFAELEGRHADSERLLTELRAVYEAAQEERRTTAQTFQELATRTLGELEATRDALREERETGVEARRDLEARHAETVRQLAVLQGAHDTLRRERDQALDVLRELEGRHLEATRRLAELDGGAQVLRQERDAAGAVVSELEARHGDATRRLAELEARHAETARALTELQAAQDTLRDERDEATAALRELGERHGELTQHLAALTGAHSALLTEHQAALEALGGAKDRPEVAEALEAILRRLRS